MARATNRGACRPFGGRLPTPSGLKRHASGPRKSPAGLGLDGPASIGCWASVQMAFRAVA
jgi:hypothetical protein